MRLRPIGLSCHSKMPEETTGKAYAFMLNVKLL